MKSNYGYFITLFRQQHKLIYKTSKLQNYQLLNTPPPNTLKIWRFSTSGNEKQRKSLRRGKAVVKARCDIYNTCRSSVESMRHTNFVNSFAGTRRVLLRQVSSAPALRHTVRAVIEQGLRSRPHRGVGQRIPFQRRGYVFSSAFRAPLHPEQELVCWISKLFCDVVWGTKHRPSAWGTRTDQHGLTFINTNVFLRVEF